MVKLRTQEDMQAQTLSWQCVAPSLDLLKVYFTKTC